MKFILGRDKSDSQSLQLILDEEYQLTQKMLELMTVDSRLGFEASNHYWYTQNDLLEKLLNISSLREQIAGSANTNKRVLVPERTS